MGSSTGRLGIIGTACVAMVLAVARPAAASDGLFKMDMGVAFVGLGGILIGTASTTANIVAGIHNGVLASRGERPSSGWLTIAYVTSSICIVGSAIMVGVFGTNQMVLVPTLTSVAVSSLTLGFTIWSHTRSEEGPRSLRVSAVPQVSFGDRGLSWGAAVKLSGF